MAEAQLLPEMTEKVYQVEGHQEVRHLLDLRVLKATNLCVQVPYDNGIPPPELI